MLGESARERGWGGGSIYQTFIKREKLGGRTGREVSGAFQLSGIVLLSFVLYVQVDDQPGLYGDLWDACWGLQGAVGLAGEVSALGLVLKRAGRGCWPLVSQWPSGRTGRASVLGLGFPPAALPSTALWSSPPPPVNTLL